MLLAFNLNLAPTLAITASTASTASTEGTTSSSYVSNECEPIYPPTNGELTCDTMNATTRNLT